MMATIFILYIYQCQLLCTAGIGAVYFWVAILHKVVLALSSGTHEIDTFDFHSKPFNYR